MRCTDDSANIFIPKSNIQIMPHLTFSSIFAAFMMDKACHITRSHQYYIPVLRYLRCDYLGIIFDVSLQRKSHKGKKKKEKNTLYIFFTQLTFGPTHKNLVYIATADSFGSDKPVCLRGLAGVELNMKEDLKPCRNKRIHWQRT